MRRITLLLGLIAITVASDAHAQTYRQMGNQLFCQDEGDTIYWAWIDYYHAVPLQAALNRANSYPCMDAQTFCDIKRRTLRRHVEVLYKAQEGKHLRQMPYGQVLQLADMARNSFVSACIASPQ